MMNSNTKTHMQQIQWENYLIYY